MNKRFITEQNDFDVFCHSLMSESSIAIDTEFMRVKTYYPEFALLQIASKNDIAIIDPLKISDWSSFKTLLNATNINKIFHAASEDLVLFWHFLRTIPKPYIDTQVICSFLSDGASLGLANALKEYLDITINKDQTRTDWLHRPLTDSQILYAYHDVEFLLSLYQTLDSKLDEKKRFFALSECEALAHKITVEKNSDLLYLQIPFVEKLNKEQLVLLQVLTKWRYEEACQRNLAVNFILNEKHFINIVEKLPTTPSELNKLGLHHNEILHHADSIIQIIKNYKSGLYQSHSLQKVKLLHNNPRYKADFSKIKQAFEKIATDEKISVQLIASRKQINQLLNVYYDFNRDNPIESYQAILLNTQNIESIDLLKYWRKDLCLSTLCKLGFVANEH